MTLQATDEIKIDGIRWSLAGEPLQEVLREWHDVPPFEASSTANWRGYVARWRVTEGRLYLTGITASVLLANGQLLEVSGRTALGGRRLPMLADFVSGEWRVFRGDTHVGADFYAFGSEQMRMTVNAGLAEFEPW